MSASLYNFAKIPRGQSCSYLSALLLESAVPFGRSPARNDRMMVGDSILFKPILWKPCPEDGWMVAT